MLKTLISNDSGIRNEPVQKMNPAKRRLLMMRVKAGSWLCAVHHDPLAEISAIAPFHAPHYNMRWSQRNILAEND